MPTVDRRTMLGTSARHHVAGATRRGEARSGGNEADLTILGTDGYIEDRKYVDLAGRPGGDHLFIADAEGVRYVDSRDVELPYGRQLVDDVLGRTETAMSQAHCFLVTELALRAQAMAHVVRN